MTEMRLCEAFWASQRSRVINETSPGLVSAERAGMNRKTPCLVFMQLTNTVSSPERASNSNDVPSGHL